MATARRLPRSERVQAIATAARRAFERDGVHETSIDAIAAEAEVSKALVLKLFGSREEILAAAILLDAEDLRARLLALDPADRPPLEHVLAMLDTVCAFAIERPAWMDLVVLLMRLPGDVLGDRVGPDRLLRLGRIMAGMLGPMIDALAALDVEDPATAANSLYMQAVGAMYFGRHGVGIRALGPGVPERFEVGTERVRRDFLAQIRASLA